VTQTKQPPTNPARFIVNKFLAEATAWLNGLIAIVILFGSASIGWAAASEAKTDTAVGFIVGSLTGAVLALLICGSFALFIQMHKELKAIRSQLNGSVGP
jgi:hypothetical protein